MRRLVIMLMLLVVPLQATWAVAAVYCQHESSLAAQHFGHHDHQHEAQDDDATDGKAPAQIDGHHHHVSDAGIVALQIKAVSSNLSVAGLVVSSADLLSSLHLERPERPKWARAV